MRAEGADVLGHRSAAEHAGHGVAADDQGEVDLGHERDQAGVPERRADRDGRGVAAVGETAGIAEAHGDDGDIGCVVEHVAGEAGPVAKAVAGGVVPGDARGVDFGAGGLADDEQAGSRGNLDDRAGTEREGAGALGASARFGGGLGQVIRHQWGSSRAG